MCRSWTDGGVRTSAGWRTISVRALIVASILIGPATLAHAGQLGSLLSPGPLAKAHAALEGGANCQRCHEAGRKVAAARCLTCHQPIADRIARRTGVHRAAKDCVSCHVEHAGVNAELRHMDTRTFDHLAETGFALDGQHAKTAANCTACHKTRSFVDVRPACGSCHTDVHKGSLGTDCTRCHSTKAAFKESRKQFDHTTARFRLTGAHREVACEKCHKTSAFRGVAFGTCSACHVDPHGKKFPATCASCHTTEKWATRSVDHTKTNFPLVGAHAKVTCLKCHQSAAMTKPVQFNQCSACHVNVHRDSVKEDCRACHTETRFQGAPFDHAGRTAFALDGKHEGVTCRKCHTDISASDVPLGQKVVDYGGARRECVACHGDKDPHKGEFGRDCDSCHKPATFSVRGFKHPRAPDFFGGQHERVACETCHVPGKALQPFRTGASAAVIAAIASSAMAPRAAVRAKAPLMECASCHGDVHLGQVGLACERCHAIDGVKFAAGKFSHERSQFPLTGKHQLTECTKCHRTETRAFPSGTGTAMLLHPVDTRCQACHKDPHLGQVDAGCVTCHDTATFTISSFPHRGMEDFFGGFHGRYACRDCHKTETGQFPAGRGTAVRFLVGRTCLACHRG